MKDISPTKLPFASAVVALVVAIAGCSTPSTDERSRAIVQTPDGIAILYVKEWFRNHMRMPMDHGSAHSLDAIVYQAFSYSTNSSQPRNHPISLAADMTMTQKGRPDFPFLVRRDDAIVALPCFPTGAVSSTGVPCERAETIRITQLGKRIEDARTEGDILVLAKGPQGETDCRVDLSALPSGISEPIAYNNTEGSAPSLHLAHFPSAATYLLDFSKDDLPIYWLSCDNAPALLGSASVAEPGLWQTVLDIAPGLYPRKPRILVMAEGLSTVTFRDIDGTFQDIEYDFPAGVYPHFLDQQGNSIVTAKDRPFRKKPGIKLTLYNVENAEKTTKEWSHGFAKWPKRP